jgi:hypothetical protein
LKGKNNILSFSVICTLVLEARIFSHCISFYILTLNATKLTSDQSCLGVDVIIYWPT